MKRVKPSSLPQLPLQGGGRVRFEYPRHAEQACYYKLKALRRVCIHSAQYWGVVEADFREHSHSSLQFRDHPPQE